MRFSNNMFFLSNFAPASIVDPDFGFTYPTVEHAYQAMKSLDSLDRLLVSQLATPNRAKQLGKTFKLRQNWDEIKLDVMEQLLRQKFSPGTHLADLLIATGSEALIEDNDWKDTYWGVYKGKGENNLGKLLMKIRKELQEGVDK